MDFDFVLPTPFYELSLIWTRENLNFSSVNIVKNRLGFQNEMWHEAKGEKNSFYQIPFMKDKLAWKRNSYQGSICDVFPQKSQVMSMSTM